MVTVELYTIKDLVADDVGPLFQARNEGVAVRQYNHVTKEVYNKNEYELWRVGYFTDKMELISDLKIILVKADEVKK